MNLRRWIAVAAWLTLGASAVAAENSLPNYGVFEQKLEQSGEYVNPYTEVRATAMLTGRDDTAIAPVLGWRPHMAVPLFTRQDRSMEVVGREQRRRARRPDGRLRSR